MTLICDRCGYNSPSSNRFYQHLHRKNICKPKVKDIDINILREKFNKLSNIKTGKEKKISIKDCCKSLKYYCDRCGYTTNNKKYFRGHVNRKNTCIPELNNIDIREVGLKYDIVFENIHHQDIHSKVNTITNKSPINSNINNITNNFPINSKVNTITNNSKVNNKINMKEFYKNFEDKSNVITLHIIERELETEFNKDNQPIDTNQQIDNQPIDTDQQIDNQPIDNQQEVKDKLNIDDFIKKNVLDELKQTDLDSDSDNENCEVPQLTNGTYKCSFCNKQLKSVMSYKRHLHLCKHKKTNEICNTIDKNMSIPDTIKQYIHSTINNNVNNLVQNSVENKVINNTYNKTNNIQIHCYGLKDLSFITNDFINSITKLPPASYLLVKDKNSNVINTNIINNKLVT